MDVPIAFGLADDRRTAARFLAERGLVPDVSRPQQAFMAAPVLQKRRHVDPKSLSEDQRYVWRHAQLDTIDEIGYDRWVKLRDHTGVVRQEQWDRQLVAAREIERLTLEADACELDGGTQVSIIDRQRVMRQRPDLYVDSKWKKIKDELKTDVPDFERGAVGVPNTWTEADWDAMSISRQSEIDTELVRHEMDWEMYLSGGRKEFFGERAA